MGLGFKVHRFLRFEGQGLLVVFKPPVWLLGATTANMVISGSSSKREPQ